MLSASMHFKFPPGGHTYGSLPAGFSSYVLGNIAKVAAPTTVPDAPTAVTATAGDGKATVAWTAPTGASSVRLNYLVQYSADAGTTWNTVNVRFAEPRAVVSLLNNGTAYVFRVAAINRVGQGAFSLASTAVTPAAPVITAPGAPTAVTATTGNGRVSLSWTAPTNAGGAQRLGYVVQYSADAGTTWSTVNFRFDDTRAVIPFLTNGKPYVFRVAAMNKAGQGAFSDPSATVTPVEPVPAPKPPKFIVVFKRR